MRENKFLSIAAGVLIGFILGTTFYICPTKMLFAGPIVGDELFLPEGMQEQLLSISAKYGGIIGAVIGAISGLTTSIKMPRGHMSKSIACMSFLVCTIVAFIQHGHFLSEMTIGRITITFLFVLFMFFIAMTLGSAVSFIERIRE